MAYLEEKYYLCSYEPNKNEASFFIIENWDKYKPFLARRDHIQYIPSKKVIQAITDAKRLMSEDGTRVVEKYGLDGENHIMLLYKIIKDLGINDEEAIFIRGKFRK